MLKNVPSSGTRWKVYMKCLDQHEGTAMMNDGHPILVFGATGRQGGSVVKALLKHWPVRAFVRDATTPASVTLRGMGVDVFAGGLDDPGAISAAMRYAYGVFLVLPGTLSAEDEVRYGTGIADLATTNGVSHIVYSSGASVGDTLTGVPRFDAKPQIETHIRNLPITSTMVRPMIFMDMLLRPGLGLGKGQLVSLISPAQAMQLTAVEDIGKFVAAIFSDKMRFAGQTLKIASDTLTGFELASALSEATGREITYSRFPDHVFEEQSDLREMAASLENGPLSEHADLAVLRQINPEILSFRAWLEGSGRKAFEEALAPAP
jgi:uncharacterized protein YbjT (DUF2867 family)